MPSTPWKPWATALPVSPLVATRTVTRRSLKWLIALARKRAPTSLNARVGPWKSSRA